MLKDITLGQYFPGNSFVHRLDPRTKLLLMSAYIVAVFIVGNMWLFTLVAAYVIGVALPQAAEVYPDFHVRDKPAGDCNGRYAF